MNDFEVFFQTVVFFLLDLQYTVMTRLTRTLALSVCFLSILLGSASPTFAQEDRKDFATIKAASDRSNINKAVDKTLQAVTDSVDKGVPSINSLVDDTSLSWQTSAFLNIAGVPADSAVVQGMSDEQKRILAERYGNGLIGSISTGIVALYTPPASSQTYIADVLESAHIIPQAQAQGLGFASLDPILETWKIFRNVAYIFFVVIFLVIGFMIMFRQKIGGQTVVTAQQAIPGVIVSLLFVTFSYAIAGFLIDLMYVLMYLLIGLFSPTEGNAVLDKNIFQLTFEAIIGKNEQFSVFTGVGDAVGTFVAGAFDGLGGIEDAIGWLAGVTAALVVAIAIAIASFKIFFELLKTYVSIVLSIAAAPMSLMMGAIPGQNNFGKWIKGLTGNLLVFPVVLMCFIIYDMFTRNAMGAGGTVEGGFLPPFIPGRGTANAIVTLVGIGVLLIIPEIVKEVKKALGAEGGVFETLGGAMIKNASQGQVAIPAAFALGEGSIAAGRGFAEARRRNLSTRETLRATFGQGVEVDPGDGSPPVMVGGAARQSVKKGFKRGQDFINIGRKIITGDAFKANDLQDALNRFVEGNKKDEDKDSKPVGTTGSKGGSG